MAEYSVSMRTREKLGNALKDLLKEKPLSKITIQELTTSCGINRQTLYYHFKDIYALTCWVFRKDCMPFLEAHDPKALLDYIDENREVCLNALIAGSDTLHEELEKEISKYVESEIKQIADSIGKDLNLDHTDADIFLETYVLTIMAVIEGRIMGRVKGDSDRIALFFNKFAFAGLQATLEMDMQHPLIG